MKAEGGRRKYKFIVDNELKSVIYSRKLFTCHSEFVLNGDQYRIIKNNFWGTKYAIKKNDDVIGTIHIGWNGISSFSLLNKIGQKKRYKLRRKSIWFFDYRLFDEKNRYICEFISKFNWRAFKHDITIKIHEQNQDETERFLVTLISITTINIMINYETISVTNAG